MANPDGLGTRGIGPVVAVPLAKSQLADDDAGRIVDAAVAADLEAHAETLMRDLLGPIRPFEGTGDR